MIVASFAAGVCLRVCIAIHTVEQVAKVAYITTVISVFCAQLIIIIVFKLPECGQTGMKYADGTWWKCVSMFSCNCKWTMLSYLFGFIAGLAWACVCVCVHCVTYADNIIMLAAWLTYTPLLTIIKSSQIHICAHSAWCACKWSGNRDHTYTLTHNVELNSEANGSKPRRMLKEGKREKKFEINRPSLSMRRHEHVKSLRCFHLWVCAFFACFFSISISFYPPGLDFQLNHSPSQSLSTLFGCIWIRELFRLPSIRQKHCVKPRYYACERFSLTLHLCLYSCGNIRWNVAVGMGKYFFKKYTNNRPSL